MHPILFEFGPFTIYTYGFCVALAFLLGSGLVLRDAEREKLSRADVLDVLIALLIGGLVGGRLLFVVINLGYFLERPLHIFMLNEGGMAFHGGLIGGVAGALLACRVKKISLWRILDLVSPYAALGHAIGRIGCFLNGCCYGKCAETGLRVTFPGETVARIPVQLYESGSLVALFLVLKFISRKKTFEGQVFAAYVMLYAVLRFATEHFRDDNPVIFAGMDLPRLISIGLLVVGAGLWAWLRGRKKQGDATFTR
jgi:phosphatidylglycerol:prolipoprotein diacylglycerol transferase